MVDVVNKRCQHPGCKKRPVFGFEGEKGRFCSLHRSGVSFVPKTPSGIISYIYICHLVPVRLGLLPVVLLQVFFYFAGTLWCE